MHSTTVMRRADQVLEEMRRHRAATPAKRPVHPGMTQREAQLTPKQAELLMLGACDDLSAARGVVNGLTAAALLWIALLAIGLFVVALTGGR